MRWGALVAALLAATALTPMSGAARDKSVLEGCNELLQRVQNEHETSRVQLGFSTESTDAAADDARRRLLDQPPCNSEAARSAGRCLKVARGALLQGRGWDPKTTEFRKGSYCAVVTVSVTTWNAVVQEYEEHEAAMLGLASRLAKQVGDQPLHLQATQWADGRSAGDLGAFLDAQLTNGLAKVRGGRTDLVPAGVWRVDAPAVRLVLTQSGDKIVGTIAYQNDLRAPAAMLEGIAFAGDLFDSTAGSSIASRSALQPRLAKSTSDAPCEGSEEHNRVTFRGRGTVYIFSVAEATGETWLVEKSAGPVDGEYVTPDPIRLVAVPGFEAGERLIAAVVPEGADPGAWTRWTPTCVVPGKLDPATKAVDGTEFFLAEPIRLRRTVDEGCSAQELPGDEERQQIAEIVERLHDNACGR